MKLLILSRGPKLYSTRRLHQAAEARGHECHIVDYLKCVMQISSAKPEVHFEGELLKGVDAVIPRIGASRTFYGCAVVRQFEMAGVHALNPSQAITRSRDKLRSLQILSQRDIGLPDTVFGHAPKDITDLMDVMGTPPVVIKLLEGTQGIGVVLAETKKAASSVIEAFRGLKANILVQEFIKEAKGADVRAIVVGNKVAASMIRQGAPGEFRSNLHRGGHAEKTRLTPEERATAVNSAKALGLRVAGVDMLRSERGPLVMEVNSSPGLEGIEVASGIDVADKIIEFMEKDVRPGGKKDRVGA